MSSTDPSERDVRMEQALGNLLRLGVLLAAVVVAVGGILYLSRHGLDPADHRVLHGEPAELRSPAGIIAAALDLRSEGIIQLGVLLLIATPVARVAFSVIGFARQRDLTYVVVTLIVLAILLYSLFFGYS